MGRDTLPHSPYEGLQPAIETFQGREEILTKIFEQLRSGIPLVLSGSRRIGKTSILRAMHKRASNDIYVIEISLQSLAQLPIIETAILLSERLAEFHELALSSDAEAVRSISDFVGSFSSKIRKELEHQQKGLLLLIDELDSLDDILNPLEGSTSMDFLQLCGLLQLRLTHVNFLFVLGRPLSSMSTRISQSSLIRNSYHIDLGLLSREETKRLATEPAKGYLEFEDDAISTLYRWSAGHPCVIQLICDALWRDLKRAGISEIPVIISGSKVDGTITQALIGGQAALQSIHGRWPNLHRIILSIISSIQVREEKVTVRDVFSKLEEILLARDETTIRSSLTELAEWHLIAVEDQRVRILSPFIARHIANMYGIDSSPIIDAIREETSTDSAYIRLGQTHLKRREYAQAVEIMKLLGESVPDRLRVAQLEILSTAYWKWAEASAGRERTDRLILAGVAAIDLAHTQYSPDSLAKATRILSILKEALKADLELQTLFSNLSDSGGLSSSLLRMKSHLENTYLAKPNIGNSEFVSVQPEDTTLLGAFSISRTPITIAQYRGFVLSGGYTIKKYWSAEGFRWLQSRPLQTIFTPLLRLRNNDHIPSFARPFEWQGDKLKRLEHPVTGINLFEAQAYCVWRGASDKRVYRLPSETEWELSCCGPNRLLYPWSNTWDETRCNCFEGKGRGTTPVGHFSPYGDSYYGCTDMLGNVWEWCSPSGRSSSMIHTHAARGGSWKDHIRGEGYTLRKAIAPIEKLPDVGFRIVLEIET